MSIRTKQNTSEGLFFRAIERIKC